MVGGSSPFELGVALHALDLPGGLSGGSTEQAGALVAEEMTTAAAVRVAPELTPFGTAFSLLVWLMLLAVNAWCFAKVFGPGGAGRPAPAEAASEPEVAEAA